MADARARPPPGGSNGRLASRAGAPADFISCRAWMRCDAGGSAGRGGGRGARARAARGAGVRGREVLGGLTPPVPSAPVRPTPSRPAQVAELLRQVRAVLLRAEREAARVGREETGGGEGRSPRAATARSSRGRGEWVRRARAARGRGGGVRAKDCCGRGRPRARASPPSLRCSIARSRTRVARRASGGRARARRRRSALAPFSNMHFLLGAHESGSTAGREPEYARRRWARIAPPDGTRACGGVGRSIRGH